ncbi:hypothetical protein AAEX63_03130 [Luteococcus sp. H138]|uniref:hypothetical protein n=1 Tax=unclassified Luteococcus TaxID=2639923 RepID=UPI00313AD5C8
MWTSDQRSGEVALPEVTPQTEGLPAAEEAPRPLSAAVKRTVRWGRYVSDVVTPTNLFFALLALVLLVVGTLGGWDKVRAASDELPVVATGSETSAAPFVVTVTKSWHTAEMGKLLTRQRGQRYLLVVGSVTSQHNEPVPSVILSKALAIDVPGCRRDGLMLEQDACHPEQLLRADSLRMGDLQPGMTQPFVAVFRQDSASPTPSQTTVILSSQVWRASRLDGGMGWWDLTPTAQLTVPTKEYRP